MKNRHAPSTTLPVSALAVRVSAGLRLCGAAQVYDIAGRPEPRVKASQCFTKYRWRPEAEAGAGGAAIVATQVWWFTVRCQVPCLMARLCTQTAYRVPW